MAPGKYGTGTITGEYRSGGTIKLKYQGTASHCGYYIVKLCKNNNPKKDICTQADFDRQVVFGLVFEIGRVPTIINCHLQYL
jgi:hypothetical protein